MDDLNKALNHLFGFKVPIDDYDEFEKKVEEARELKEHLDKVEILKDIPQIVTPVKMTNYDRIKSMSVEEMANFLEINGSDDFHVMTDGAQCRICEKRGNCKEDCNFLDTYGVKEWLLQEVSENE